MPAGTIPAQVVTAGLTITVDVTPFFRDPDGGTLTYAAASSDDAVVSVALAGSDLTMTAVAAGTATVTVTATDPDGLAATQSVQITVEPEDDDRAGFRDDFATRASLADWNVRGGTVAIVGGILYVTRSEAGQVAVAERWFDLTSWTLRTRLGRAESLGVVSVYLDTEDDRYSILDLSIGIQSYDYRLRVFDSQQENFVVISDWSGYSGAIHDGAGELTDFTLGYDGEDFIGVAGDTELFRTPISEASINGTPLHPILDRVTRIRLLSRGSDNTSAIFDWVELFGIESSASTTQAPGARPAADSSAKDLVDEAIENPERPAPTRGASRNTSKP
ncbi:MAG: hypothetical protein F4164_05645 [Gemmatimonadales bacterium]|nr:hypothetical protein [Gemmatimonadales bacterium]MYG48853.1 hypothetical protein [Gemmatimonadales bacterium]